MSAVVNQLQGPAQADPAALMSRTISDASLRKQYRLDQLFRHATRFFAFLVLALLAGILISLLVGSLSSIRTFGFGFFASAEWNPVTEQFGALVPIVGTLTTSAIALLIGIPVSFGIALFLTELSPSAAPGTAERIAAAEASLRAGHSPFDGPLTDREGKLRVPAGVTPSQAAIERMDWWVPGVVGDAQ